MTAQFRQRIETTYADLRPTDLVIDKAGNAWPIADLEVTGDKSAPTFTFWLVDAVSGIKMHNITKDSHDAVTVSRAPSHADEASKLEADFPKSGSPESGTGVTTGSVETGATGSTETDSTTPPAGVAENVYANAVVSLADAIAAVEEIGGTVEAEVTAAEVDAAAAATDDAPLTIIPFADMTPLEARSHLYLLHGVYGHDLQSRAELAALHDQAHAATAAGTLNSRHVPHVHEVKP